MSALPVIKSQPADSTCWKTLTEIEGYGRLKSVGVAHSYNDISMVRIHYDDRTITSKLANGYDVGGDNGLNLDIPFTDYLHIEIRDRNHDRPHTRFWASYILGDTESDEL
jgi:hypothetical protein